MVARYQNIGSELLRSDEDGAIGIAMDAGAKRVMFPTENRRDFAELPAEIIDKLQIDFYSDPSQAAFKALLDT